MRLRLRTAALGACLTWSAVGCSIVPGPSPDWRPSAVADYTVPTDGTPPPWSVSERPDPFGITAGPDGNMWFTEPVFNRIGRITPDGHVTQFALPIAGKIDHPDPLRIVCGGDGALWFAGSRLGRITTSGHVTIYSDIYYLAEGMLSRLAPARDGVWFLSTSLGHIGKNGVPTWYRSAKDRSTGIESIFADPQHRVWALTREFREGFGISELLSDGSLRGKLTFTPSYGTITSIVAATDGTFWIADGNGSSAVIEHVFVDGHVVMRATLPNAYYVAGGPHGTVIAQGIKYLSQLSPSGPSATFYPDLQHVGIIGGVTEGPAGTIWLTEADGSSRIAKITP